MWHLKPLTIQTDPEHGAQGKEKRLESAKSASLFAR